MTDDLYLNRRARFVLRLVNSDPDSELRLALATSLKREYSEKAIARALDDLASRGLIDGTSPTSATITASGALAIAALPTDAPYRRPESTPEGLPPAIESPPLTPPAIRMERRRAADGTPLPDGEVDLG